MGCFQCAFRKPDRTPGDDLFVFSKPHVLQMTCVGRGSTLAGQPDKIRQHRRNQVAVMAIGGAQAGPRIYSIRKRALAAASTHEVAGTASSWISTAP